MKKKIGRFMDRTTWKLEEICMVLVFFSLPFDRITTLFTMGSGIYITIPKLLIGVTMVIYFLRAIIIADQTIVTSYFTNKTNILFAAFLLVSFCTVFNAHDIKEFSKEFLRRTNLIVLFFLVINVIKRFDVLKVALASLMIGAVIAGLGGLYEIITQKAVMTVNIRGFVRSELLATPAGGFRIQSFSGDPDNHVTNMVIYSGIAGGFFFLVRSKILKFFILLTSILFITNIIASASRSGILAFLCVLAVFFVFIEMKRKMIFLVFSLGMIGLLYLFLTMFTDIATLERFTSAGGGYSVSFREGHLILNMSMVSEHPVMGVGTGNFKTNYIRHIYSRGLEDKLAGVAIDDHLPFFQILAENGIVGFTIFVLMIASVITMMFVVIKRSSDISLRILTEGLIGSMAGIIVIYCSLPSLLNELGWLVMASGVVAWNIYRSTEEKKPIDLPFPRTNLSLARIRLRNR